MTNISNAYLIQVGAGQGSQPDPELLAVLEGLFPVKFGSFPDRLAGEIMIEGAARADDRSRVAGVSTLKVQRNENSSGAEEAIELTVNFANDSEVPFPFRGRTVRTKVGPGARTLQLGANEKALAHSAEGPVWSVSKEPGVKHFRSGFPLPNIPAGVNLQDVLNGEHFLELIPLLHWIRQFSPVAFQGPPLRACFIFDDPNLHWPQYGFVNYRQIAARAAKENYHVSFATIPLDTWFTHKPTAELFKRNDKWLSLSVHGNDHVKQELARNYTESERISLLTQSIQRIERLERNAGVEVSRVMVPPHGACSEAMLGDLPRNGFEAGSISHGSLRAHNKNSTWMKTLGYFPCELIHGCPVMPRWSLTVNKNTILLAAFLNQTLIFRGHHQDVKNGIEVLDEFAQFINGLGAVSWSNLTGLSRTNYQWRNDGNICRLRPMSPKVAFPVPAGAASLVVENTWNGAWANWRISGANGSKIEARSGKEVSLSGEVQGTILLEAVRSTTGQDQNHKRRSAPRAVIRRLLAEGRDRFMFWQ